MSDERSGAIPVVCLHGWAMSSVVWQPLLDKLPLQRSVSCPDLPGHGLAAPLANMDLDSIAAHLAAGVKRPAIWIGWSLGAIIAVHIARRYPDKVSGLVLLANTPRFVADEDWPFAVDEKIFSDFGHDLAQDYERTLRRFMALQVLGTRAGNNMKACIRQLQKRLTPPDPAALEQGLNILLHTDQRDDYRQLDIPVSCILGGKDTLVPAAAASAIDKLNERIEVHCIDDAGHAPLLSHSERIAQLVESMCEAGVDVNRTGAGHG